ncbi:hypothetical protein [Streptomyces sp. NPDC006012]|uniref:hypothetical protein n=1 Tax=Streptomyces sp. NPDC006012 TaxID=3364739 RepID=UPI00367A65E5
MGQDWKANPAAGFVQRLGKSPKELDVSSAPDHCPDLWLLDNDDVAVIGQDLTEAYRRRLPEGIGLAPGERLVVIPGVTLRSAKRDIPDE